MNSPPGFEEAVLVRRCPTEKPLLIMVIVAALCLWMLLIFSFIGIFYAVLIAVFFFLGHLAFIAHLRGSGVRLGPEQMPELHRRVGELSGRLGMRQPPVAYVIQAGGQLNALATKFLGSQFIVLYSDLLEACGENDEARDFIVAHELGHLKAGHLRARWLLLPGLLVPFLGSAYSRACEYTSDQYGLAGTRDKEKALEGLCILSAGGTWGPRINRTALVHQRADVNTFWMIVGTWMSTHPPIASRLAVLQPDLGAGQTLRRGPALAAAAGLFLLVLLPAGTMIIVARKMLPAIKAQMEQQSRAQASGAGTAPGLAPRSSEQVGTAPGLDPRRSEALSGIDSLVAAAEAFRKESGLPPPNVNALYRSWGKLHPGAKEPIDPFGSKWYGYASTKHEYFIWSIGPDPESGNDDLEYSSEYKEYESRP